ncbi:MAG TPA: TetR/AcrR family transcriptional regulator [Pseudonocardia sp.]|nr:TetR/AcrR family transcriptional regulator [Pseudonocardia sp.]
MTAPRPDRAGYHHGDLPRALVDASVGLIARHGVDGFSLRSAAREAGVNPAAVYRHFADRADLLRAVSIVGFRELADRMDEAMSGAGDPAARFAAGGAAYVRFALERPEFFRVMFGRHGAGPDGIRGRGAGRSGRSAYDLLLGALRDLDAECGLVLALDDAVTVAWSAVHGLASLLVDGVLELTGTGVDAAVGATTRTAMRGLTR